MIARRDQFLPYSLPSIGEEEIAEVVECLRFRLVDHRTQGPAVRGGLRAICWRQACHCGEFPALLRHKIALKALGIGPGDEVIVPAISFSSIANVIVQAGARPVLVDVLDDFCIDPDAVRAAITPRTSAIIPVHFGGQACALRDIYELAAQKRACDCLRDAAHAVGSVYAGAHIGSDALRQKPGAWRRCQDCLGLLVSMPPKILQPAREV